MSGKVSILIVEGDPDSRRAVTGIITSRYRGMSVDAMSDLHLALQFLHRLRHDILLCDLPLNAWETPNVINDIYATDTAPVSIFTTTDSSFTLDSVPPSVREK